MTSKNKIIYVFGNPLLNFDSLPIKLLPELKKEFPGIDFVIKDPNENLYPENKHLTIIDTVLDLEQTTLITDIEKIAEQATYSLHDLDLGFNLKLLKKLGVLETATIIGVPPQGNKKKIFSEIIATINRLDEPI